MLQRPLEVQQLCEFLEYYYPMFSYTSHVAQLSIWLCRIVAMLEKNGTLRIANVGDCGLRVIRGGKCI